MVCRSDGDSATVPTCVHKVTRMINSERDIYSITWQELCCVGCVDGEMEVKNKAGACLSRAWFYVDICYARVYYYTGQEAVDIANGSKSQESTIKLLEIEKLSHMMPSISDNWSMTTGIPGAVHISIPSNASYYNIVLTRSRAQSCSDYIQKIALESDADRRVLVETRQVTYIEQQHYIQLAVDSQIQESNHVKPNTEIRIFEPKSDGAAGWTLVLRIQYDEYINTRPRTEKWWDYKCTHGNDGGSSLHFVKNIPSSSSSSSSNHEDDSDSDDTNSHYSSCDEVDLSSEQQEEEEDNTNGQPSNFIDASESAPLIVIEN